MRKEGTMLNVILLVFCTVAHAAKYSNSVLDRDFPDPTVMKASNGYYYVYGTQGSGCKIQVAQSTNLIDWKWLGEALPHPPSWASTTHNFWAPDVMEHDGVYWMYYAAEHDGGGMCIAVANSTKPEGPFVTSNTPLICNSDFRDIDPKQFVDPKTNHTYLFWGSDFAPIRVQQLAAERMSFAKGSSSTAVLYPDNSIPYQNLVEGAWVEYRNGEYFLFFSGNNCCGANAHYAVMVARASSITGPYQKMAGTVLSLNSKWDAPGHNSVVRDKSGVDWMYYHAYHSGQNVNGPRVLMMDKITWRSDGWPSVNDGHPSTGPVDGPNA